MRDKVWKTEDSRKDGRDSKIDKGDAEKTVRAVGRFSDPSWIFPPE